MSHFWGMFHFWAECFCVGQTSSKRINEKKKKKKKDEVEGKKERKISTASRKLGCTQ